MTPTEENKTEIFRLTEETRANRKRRSVVEQMSLDTVLNVFPRFKDFNGEMVRLFPINTSIVLFPRYIGDFIFTLLYIYR